MVYRKTENAMKEMISDTILALCRNKVPYQTMVRVEGLLGITLDDQEIFLVSLNETIRQDDELELTEILAETAGRRPRPRGGKRHISDLQESSESETEAKRLRGRKAKKRPKLKDSRKMSDEDSTDKLFHETRLLHGNENINLDETETNVKRRDGMEVRHEQMGHYGMGLRDITTDLFSEPSLAQAGWPDPMDTRPGTGIEHLQHLAFQLSRDLHNQPAASVLPVLQTSTDTILPPPPPAAPQTSHYQENADIDKRKDNICQVCGREFQGPGEVATHVQQTHTGEKLYKCATQQTHTTDKPYKCNMCPAGFNQEKFLLRHIKSHTGTDTVHMVPFKCSKCQQPFCTTKDYNEHKSTCMAET